MPTDPATIAAPFVLVGPSGTLTEWRSAEAAADAFVLATGLPVDPEFFATDLAFGSAFESAGWIVRRAIDWAGEDAAGRM